MLSFAHPGWLLLWLPLAAAAARVYGRRNRHGILFPPTGRVAVPQRTWRSRLAGIFPALFLLGIALAIAALARPQQLHARIRHHADSISIAMVADISGSMEAVDFSEPGPDGSMQYRSRLDVVKDTFESFVRRRPHDLIGLIAFGGYASTRVPLTLDHDALLRTMRAVEIPQPSPGRPLLPDEVMTAIGDALMTACARLQEAETQTRIVVLLSDGESNTGLFTPERAAETAAELGIRVYTIGVGQSGPTPFLRTDRFGRERITMEQEQFDESQLRHIARATGARYFSALDQEGLEAALHEIDRLETTEIEEDRMALHQERFTDWLWPALGLILLGAAGNTWTARRIV